MTTQTNFKVIDLAPRIGSKIEADLESLLSGIHSAEIRALLEERGVVVFPQLNLTDQQQIAFTKSLGTFVPEGVNQIYKVSLDPTENAAADYLKGAFFWHIDGTMQENRLPIFASILSCRKPSPTGGQTEFSNTYAAYDDLSKAEQQAFEKLQVVHSFEVSQRYVNPEPSYAQFQAWRKNAGTNTLPLVWKHRSGRKSLVLGVTASYIQGMSQEDSTDLLIRLRDHATQPQFVYRHEWTVGDVVIWDNTGTMHRALPYALDSGRMMHRTKLQGEESLA